MVKSLSDFFAGQKLLGKRRPVVGQVLFVAEQDNPTAEVAAAQRLYGFSPGKSPANNDERG